MCVLKVPWDGDLGETGQPYSRNLCSSIREISIFNNKNSNKSYYFRASVPNSVFIFSTYILKQVLYDWLLSADGQYGTYWLRYIIPVLPELGDELSLELSIRQRGGGQLILIGWE